MPASHSPKFVRVEINAKDAVGGWRGSVVLVNARQDELAFTEKSVYVIRLVRPFTIPYGKKHSPTLYIGRGNFKSRFTSHLKWIRHFGDCLDVRIEVRFCNPRFRGRDNGDIYKDLEADLITRFKSEYGRIPIFNKNEPLYKRKDVFQ